ncbi:MAG: glycerol-3-phosphate dehydrogenase [Rubellimicrobium sp.]|nr:glycerol-3-phosphate dehydrogenase [Rubellimicrobium sp.]
MADCDLLVIGGGVNGCAIARDAAGRGLRVVLAEKDDLAAHTSSASTKLFHGGLRYLDYWEFRLVRESLIERERLLRAMPHISWPMRFVLPYDPAMTFESDSPTSRLLRIFMPWLRGRRPAWLIRLGLFIYDHLGGREMLPGTTTLDLRIAPEGRVLRPGLRRAWEYSDGWVQDSRLVALMARDAAQRGAQVLTRTTVTAAGREGDLWRVTLTDAAGPREVTTRAVVNAAGPWVEDVLHRALGGAAPAHVRLVRGSHVVVPRLYDHDKCYFFQGSDGRIVFAIPYEGDFTLIGTTDEAHTSADTPPEATGEEQDYLCAFVSRWFARPVTRADVVWSYSGVRPLYDDHASSATAATRDYVLVLDDAPGAPLLSVFGGKITTCRRLAEHALEKLVPLIGGGPDWTAGVALPGGDFAMGGQGALVAALRAVQPGLPERDALRLVRCYGTEAAQAAAAGGRDFGAGLCEAEVRWLMAHEFARRAEDVVWRRTKLGLRMTPAQIAALDDWMLAEGG